MKMFPTNWRFDCCMKKKSDAIVKEEEKLCIKDNFCNTLGYGYCLGHLFDGLLVIIGAQAASFPTRTSLSIQLFSFDEEKAL